MTTSYDLYTGPPVPTLPAVASTGRYPLPDNISVYYFFDPPNRYRVPLTQFWNAAIQHQITPTMSLEAAYVGNVGRHIYRQCKPEPGCPWARRLQLAATLLSRNLACSRVFTASATVTIPITMRSR